MGKKHRFPNLACEKISGYWKEKGAEVHLLMDFNLLLALGDFTEEVPLFNGQSVRENAASYDKIYIPKVFTDTPVPEWINALSCLAPDENRKIQMGGTGF